MQQRKLINRRKPVRTKSASFKHRKRLCIVVATIGAAITLTALIRA